MQNLMDVEDVDLPEGEALQGENEEFNAGEQGIAPLLDNDHFQLVHQVRGARRQPLYTVGDGFYYRCDSQYREGLYRMRCTFNRSAGCLGTATMKIEDDTMTLQTRQEHICQPNPTYGELNELKARLNERAAASITGTLRQIFDEECRNVPQEVACQVSFNAVEAGMRRARSAAVRGRGRGGRGREARGQRGGVLRGQRGDQRRVQRGGRRGRGNRPVAVGEQLAIEQVAPLQPPDVEPVAVGEQQVIEQAAPLQPPDVEDDEDNNSCVICRTNVRALVAVPCGHYGFCYTCAAELQLRMLHCGVCRLPVDFYMPVYNVRHLQRPE